MCNRQALATIARCQPQSKSNVSRQTRIQAQIACVASARRLRTPHSQALWTYMRYEVRFIHADGYLLGDSFADLILCTLEWIDSNNFSLYIDGIEDFCPWLRFFLRRSTLHLLPFRISCNFQKFSTGATVIVLLLKNLTSEMNLTAQRTLI